MKAIKRAEEAKAYGPVGRKLVSFAHFIEMPVSVMSVVSALVDFEIEKNNSSK